MHFWYFVLIYLIGLIAVAVYFYHDSKKVTAEDSEMPFFIAVFICVFWPFVAAGIACGWAWSFFCRVWDAAIDSKE